MPPNRANWLLNKIIPFKNNAIVTFTFPYNSQSSFSQPHRNQSSTTPAKRRKTWQERVESLAETFAPPLPLSKTEEDNLTGILQSLLNRGIIKDSTDKRVKSHFQGLLDGLQTLTHVSGNEASSFASSTILTRKSLLPLSEKQREKAITETSSSPLSSSNLVTSFDELYYNGELSRKTAALILKHKSISSVDDVSHIVMLVSNGGAGLHRWSSSDKHTFQLQIANKFWNIGEPEKSKALIVDCFESVWEPVLKDRILNPYTVVGYGKALLVFKRRDILERLLSSWSYDTFGGTNVATTISPNISIASTAATHNPTSSSTSTSPSDILSSLFLPLWKAAISFKDFDLSEKIIQNGLICSIAPSSIESSVPTNFDSVLLYTYTLSTLYNYRKLDEPFIQQLIAKQFQSIPVPKPGFSNQSQFLKHSIYYLMDLCSSLSLSNSSSHNTIALEMLPFFEAFTNSTLKQSNLDDRTRAILPARLSLLQLNLSNHKNLGAVSTGYEHVPEIITP